MTVRSSDYFSNLQRNVVLWLNETGADQIKWTEYIMNVPELFLLLVKLSEDPDIPEERIPLLQSAIDYFYAEDDFIPEAQLGILGFVDDAAVAAYVLKDLINELPPDVILRNWLGPFDIFLFVQDILSNADKMLGATLWKKIRMNFADINKVRRVS